MAWYKYQQHWAWGVSKPKYIQYDPKNSTYDDLGDYLEENEMVSNWSDKWRRVTWVQVPRPPKKVLEQMVSCARDSVKYAKIDLKHIKAEMTKLYPEKKK